MRKKIHDNIENTWTGIFRSPLVSHGKLCVRHLCEKVFYKCGCAPGRKCLRASVCVWTICVCVWTMCVCVLGVVFVCVSYLSHRQFVIYGNACHRHTMTYSATYSYGDFTNSPWCNWGQQTATLRSSLSLNLSILSINISPHTVLTVHDLWQRHHLSACILDQKLKHGRPEIEGCLSGSSERIHKKNTKKNKSFFFPCHCARLASVILVIKLSKDEMWRV